MSEVFLTVERAAERLTVHPRTILRFIREGRLRAMRIGKSWRIRGSDLHAFVGMPEPAPAHEPPRVTAIADMRDISMEVSQRMATALQAALMGRGDRSRPIKLDTVYDPEQLSLKIIIVADALDAATLLKSLDGFAEAFR